MPEIVAPRDLAGMVPWGRLSARRDFGPKIKGSCRDPHIDTGDRGELGYRVFRMKTAIVGARAASPVPIRRVT
jgi:hypothetical protein